MHSVGCVYIFVFFVIKAILCVDDRFAIGCQVKLHEGIALYCCSYATFQSMILLKFCVFVSLLSFYLINLLSSLYVPFYLCSSSNFHQLVVDC